MNTYIAALYQGTFSVGLDKVFHRIPRDGKPNRGALKISLNPFLVVSASKVMLFDTGIGYFADEEGAGIMRENLEHFDLDENDVTDVFLTHLHIDHMGGLAHKENGYWELSFPDAKVWTSEKDWNKLIAADHKDPERGEYFAFLNARLDLHLLKDSDQPYPEIRSETIGGHSEFHLAYFYEDEHLRFLNAGDVMATRNQINRKFEAKYDFDPAKSQRERERLAKLAYDKDYLVLGFHDDSHPIVKLTGFDEKTGYSTEPVPSYEP